MRELKLLNDNNSNPSVDRPRWRPNKADTRSEAELNIKPADERCCGVHQRSKGIVREGAKPSHEQAWTVAYFNRSIYLDIPGSIL